MNPESLIPTAAITKIDRLALANENFIDLMTAIMAKGHSIRFKAQGSSMYPFIWNNDVITVSPLKHVSLKPGQVVAFPNPKTGMLQIHRIIKAEKDKYLIKGDNVRISDGVINMSKILGLVSKVEREGKNIDFRLTFFRSLLLKNREYFKKFYYRLFIGKKYAI